MAIKKPKISTAGEARENLLSAAEILHEDFEKTGDLKVITQALKAYNIALNSSKYSIYPFDEKVRPQSIGTYNSPIKIDQLSYDELMLILLKSNKILKGSDKIVSAVDCTPT